MGASAFRLYSFYCMEKASKGRRFDNPHAQALLVSDSHRTGVCMYPYTHVRIAYTQVCNIMHMHIYYIGACEYLHIHKYILSCTHTCIWIDTHSLSLYIYICICIYFVYLYIHIYIFACRTGPGRLRPKVQAPPLSIWFLVGSRARCSWPSLPAPHCRAGPHWRRHCLPGPAECSPRRCPGQLCISRGLTDHLNIRSNHPCLGPQTQHVGSLLGLVVSDSGTLRVESWDHPEVGVSRLAFSVQGLDHASPASLRKLASTSIGEVAAPLREVEAASRDSMQTSQTLPNILGYSRTPA